MATTSLPWVTGLIMPDIFTSVLVIAVFLLGFRADRLRGIERACLYAMVVISITGHLSHAPLALAQIGFIALSGMVFRRSIRLHVTKWWLMALPLAVSLGLMIGNNIIYHGTAQLSPGGYCFQLARLVTDGPAVSYLENHCPHRKYALCDYIDEFPDTADEFLWPLDSPFNKVGGFYGYWREAREIVMGTVKEYPWWVFRGAISNTVLQVTRFSTGEGFLSYVNGKYPTEAIRKHFPNEYHQYASSRQNRNELDLQRVNRLHRPVVLLGIVLTCLGFVFYLKSGDLGAMVCLLFFVFSILANCIITGAASEPDPRYLNRLIWLFPFFGISIVWDFVIGPRQRAGSEETPSGKHVRPASPQTT